MRVRVIELIKISNGDDDDEITPCGGNNRAALQPELPYVTKSVVQPGSPVMVSEVTEALRRYKRSKKTAKTLLTRIWCAEHEPPRYKDHGIQLTFSLDPPGWSCLEGSSRDTRPS